MKISRKNNVVCAVCLVLLAGFLISTQDAMAGSEFDDVLSKKSGRENWRFVVSKLHGTNPKLSETEQGIKLAPLISSNANYLNYIRRVEIKEGVTYKGSFEARLAQGTYSVRIVQGAGLKMTHVLHYKSKTLEASSDFQIHEFEFTAKPPPRKKGKNKEEGDYIKDAEARMVFQLGVGNESFELNWVKFAEVK